MTSPITRSRLDIVGAGMAGLLAAEMLRRYQPTVFERQAELPDNHGALLRFRSDAVARETRQTFRKVRVYKAVKSGKRLRGNATITDANQYAFKVAGVLHARSVLNLDACDRYVAPDNFLAMLARDAKLELSATVGASAFMQRHKDQALISTIPMPMLMKIVGWRMEEDQFQYRGIWSATAEFEAKLVNVYQTIYYPDPKVPHYRASITGNRLIVEYAGDQSPDLGVLHSVIKDFGIPAAHAPIENIRTHQQQYGKLIATNHAARHEFITAMTDQYNIYSVGRFATWRQLLLDDVVQDIHIVERMIAARSTYQRRLEAR